MLKLFFFPNYFCIYLLHNIYFIVSLGQQSARTSFGAPRNPYRFYHTSYDESSEFEDDYDEFNNHYEYYDSFEY